MSFKRILVAVDNEPVAARAVDVAIDLARAVAGELSLVCVVDPAAANAGAGTGLAASELVALAQADARRLLESFRERAGRQPLPLEFVVVGKPAAEIVKAAKEWPADVIVIGSHGRGGVSRVLLGSVAEAVMRHATCPVLVVRALE